MVFQVTLSHMFVFFLVFAVGFAASKLRVIRENSLPTFAQVITKVLLPCMIFYSTYANCKRETIIDNWEMVLLAALFYAAISLLIFVMAEVPIFEPLQLGLSTVSSATTGMCMLYLGTLASFSRVLPVLERPELYVGIAVKMIVLPVVAARLIAMAGIFPGQMVLALAIIMALPVMTVVPMVVANNGKEYEYATGITVVTLVASIVTIPLVVFLTGL